MWRRIVPIVYVLLLVASHAYQRFGHQAGAHDAPLSVSVPAMNDAGPVSGQQITLAYNLWEPSSPAGKQLALERSPVVLIHGSPGEGSNFSKSGPLLAEAGFRVYAPDLPGFGGSGDQPSLSTLAHARAVLAMMDQLHIDRAHVLGWSMGGGVVLHLAQLAKDAGHPERIASLTLMGAVGRQENEQSGSYGFEHFKYKAGKVLFGYGFDLLPHFGLLGPHTFRMNWLRNFDDTDFRLHDPIIASIDRPVMILHGVHDMLIPIRAARDHFARMPTSSLTIIDANHFIAFMQPDDMARHLPPFWNAVDRNLPRPRHDITDVGGPRHGSAALLERLEPAIVSIPWWAMGLLIAILTWFAPTAGVLAAAVLVDGLLLDNVLAIIGIAAGFWLEAAWRVARGIGAGTGEQTISNIDWSRRFDRGTLSVAWDAWRSQFVASDRTEMSEAAGLLRRRLVLVLLVRFVAAIAWAALALIPALIVLGLTMRPTERMGSVLNVGVALALAAMLAALIPTLVTRRGRQHLRRRWARLTHHEYWLAWFFYAPLVPMMLPYLHRNGGIRRTLMCPTAVNPGMSGSGGFVGESKAEIMEALAAGVRGLPESTLLLSTLLIPPGEPEIRVKSLVMQMETSGVAFPLILKPDSGCRGFGVKLIAGREAALAYFREVRTEVIAQPFHPGPHECGICWVRDASPRADGLAGSIFSITRKDFPVIEGDGKRTLEELIWAHRRFRNQAPVFMARHADRRSWIPAKGELVKLGVSGNHCQGTLFRDGDDLRSPELHRAIDVLARNYAGRGVKDGLDFGRFDLRYASEADLLAGRNFAVVELNGALGESTNLYDPERSTAWAYSVLCAQWRALFDLGRLRSSQGRPTITMMELVRSIRAYFRNRSGSELAD